MKDKKITYISLGCFKNDVDTEVILGMLRERGFKIIPDSSEAQYILINTCGFITSAKEESIDTILNAIDRKKQGLVEKVFVTGCLSERYYKDLKEEFKEIDILWGVNDPEGLVNAIETGSNSLYKPEGLFLMNENHKRFPVTSPNSTYLKISEGCNMKCAFCSIPSIRGSFRSRTIDSIVREAESLREKGFEELNLISQNSTHFGRDMQNSSMLPELLNRLSEIDFPWIRVLYLMPEEVTDEIIEAFDNRGVLPYFDLPFQHISSKVLKNMNRKGSFESHMNLIRKIRTRFPQATIRSTFITGFPGESDKDFEELENFVRLSEIERVGAFSFSKEENTPAFDMKDQIDSGIAESRRELIMDISDENIMKYNTETEGSVQDFIPLSPCPWDHNSTIGRIASQAPEVDGLTVINSKFDDIYKIYKVKITSGENEILYGEEL